jgi:hypothetical protein
MGMLGEVPYVPTPEREATLKAHAFDAGYWVWKNRADGEGPVDVFPPAILTALARTAYERAIIQEAYVNGLVTGVAQEKSTSH